MPLLYDNKEIPLKSFNGSYHGQAGYVRPDFKYVHTVKVKMKERLPSFPDGIVDNVRSLLQNSEARYLALLDDSLEVKIGDSLSKRALWSCKVWNGT